MKQPDGLTKKIFALYPNITRREQIAAELGVSLATVRNWELGSRPTQAQIDGVYASYPKLTKAIESATTAAEYIAAKCFRDAQDEMWLRRNNPVDTESNIATMNKGHKGGPNA